MGIKPSIRFNSFVLAAGHFVIAIDGLVLMFLFKECSKNFGTRRFVPNSTFNLHKDKAQVTAKIGLPIMIKSFPEINWKFIFLYFGLL